MSLENLKLQIELNNMNKRALSSLSNIPKSIVSNGVSNGYKNLWKTQEEQNNYLISEPILNDNLSQYFKTPTEDFNDYYDRIQIADLPITFKKERTGEETEAEYVDRIHNQLLKLEGTMNSKKNKNRQELRLKLLTISNEVMTDAIMNSDLFKNDYIVNEVLNIWNKLIKDIKSEYNHIDSKLVHQSWEKSL